ncbi:Ras-related protein Rab-6.2 [Nosema granulosis]|uniref:Ras-related protein Rab-6.2 n=1 Tax=Nosema granulosis TaxID=83296 RepID=A0A9P6H243_9MICR|nr:Ras-related protein Rab-6.2 [Nosema granulosis]
MSQYLHQKVEKSYGPTIGLDFVSTTITVCGHRARLQLWDTAGQERFNSIIPNYTRNSFLTIIVFDLTDNSSFERINYWINDLVRINDPNHKIKVLIVGNKSDLVSEDTRKEFRELGEKKAKEHGGLYVETCAMKYEGIKELIDALNSLIEDDILNHTEEEESNKETIMLERTGRSSCCGGVSKKI